MAGTYRLGEREALVVVMGLLPPPGAYFSLITYAFTRQGAPDTSQPLYQALTEPFMRSMVFLTSPNPSRALSFRRSGIATTTWSSSVGQERRSTRSASL